MRNMIGIMGGRLSDHIHSEIQSFSEKSWKTEFVKAEQIGFEVLEWVFDFTSLISMSESQAPQFVHLPIHFGVQIHNFDIRKVFLLLPLLIDLFI